MTPESQFLGAKLRKRRKSRKLEKNYDVKVLPDAKARGRYQKGSGFNKRTRIKGRSPVYIPTSEHNAEDAFYWLRVKRS